MEVSQSLQNKAKKLGVSVQYMIAADLIVLGYTENDAYTIAFPENIGMGAQRNRKTRDNIFASAKFKNLVNERSNIQRDIVTPQHDESELMDKDRTARLIMKAALAQPADSKERIEGLMKYSDLMGYKKNDIDDDGTDAIQFFFPVKCHQCPLYNAYNLWRKNQGEKEVRPVDMEGIIRKADAVIKSVE